VIAGEEEEGLDNSVVTMLVSCYFVSCGFARTQEHSFRSVAAVFLFTAKPASYHGHTWHMAHTIGGRKGIAAGGCRHLYCMGEYRDQQQIKIPGTSCVAISPFQHSDLVAHAVMWGPYYTTMKRKGGYKMALLLNGIQMICSPFLGQLVEMF